MQKVDSHSDDQTSLHAAIHRVNAPIVKLLLDHGANPNMIPVPEPTNLRALEKQSVPLLHAVYQVRWTIQRLPQIKERKDPERTAKAEGFIESAQAIARMLITHKNIEIDVQHSGGGGAALHIAALAGQIDLAELLLKRGAKVDSRSKQITPGPVRLPPYKQTPLHVAYAAGQTKFAEFLLKHGADPDAKDNRGRVPSYYREGNRRN